MLYQERCVRDHAKGRMGAFMLCMLQPTAGAIVGCSHHLAIQPAYCFPGEALSASSRIMGKHCKETGTHLEDWQEVADVLALLVILLAKGNGRIHSEELTEEG